MIDKSKIEDIVYRIINQFNPEQIFLIGSYEKGNSNRDID